MKRLFKNGWIYVATTFVAPIALSMLTMAISSHFDLRENPVLGVLLCVLLVPIIFNILFGPTMWAYWRGCVSLKPILIWNIVSLILGFAVGHPIVPNILYWWTMFGKTRHQSEPNPMFSRYELNEDKY